MKTFSIIFISFIFFSTLVRAQSETAANPATAASPATSTSAPDKISQCLQNQGCSYSDINCVAWCAGVPNPSPQDVNATNDCIASCPNTTNAGYQSCVSGCINSHYNQPTVYGTSSGAPPTQTGIGSATPAGVSASASASASATSTNKSPSTPNPISVAPSLIQFKPNLYFALFLAILVAAIFNR